MATVVKAKPAVGTTTVPHTAVENNDGLRTYTVSVPAAKQPAGVDSNLLIEKATTDNETRKENLVKQGRQAESV